MAAVDNERQNALAFKNPVFAPDNSMAKFGGSLSESILRAARFGVVGLISNLTLYVIYFVLVEVEFDSKAVVTLLYVLGLSVTIIFNKRWSFSHRGGVTQSLKRYLFLYGALYITNILVLWVFVDVFSLPHAVVQASVVSAFIPVVFLAQRYWVFPTTRVFPFTQEKHREFEGWHKKQAEF